MSRAAAPSTEGRSAEALDQALRALAHPGRRTMLRLVTEEERSAGELAAAVGLSSPAASQHLKVLRDAGLVSVSQMGTRRLYRLDPTWLRALRDELSVFWSDSLGRLKEAAEAAERDRR